MHYRKAQLAGWCATTNQDHNQQVKFDVCNAQDLANINQYCSFSTVKSKLSVLASSIGGTSVPWAHNISRLDICTYALTTLLTHIYGPVVFRGLQSYAQVATNLQLYKNMT